MAAVHCMNQLGLLKLEAYCRWQYRRNLTLLRSQVLPLEGVSLTPNTKLLVFVLGFLFVCFKFMYKGHLYLHTVFWLTAK